MINLLSGNRRQIDPIAQQFALVATVMFISFPGPACADDATKEDNKDGGALSLNLALDTSYSKYGTSRSYSNALTTTLSYDTENFGYSLSIPYVHQSDPVGAVFTRFRLPPRIASRIAGKIASLDTNASGLGDVEASVTRYLIDDTDNGLTFDVRGSLKIPTADQSKGLGSGEKDYTVEMNLGKTYGKFAVTGTAGYMVLGSPGRVTIQGTQQNIILNNIFYGALDGAFTLGNKTRLGLTLNAAQASSSDASSQKDVTLYFNVAGSKSSRIRIYGLKGLANGSPDSAGGASASLTF